MKLSPVVLEDAVVRLEPFTPAMAAGTRIAYAVRRQGDSRRHTSGQSASRMANWAVSRSRPVQDERLAGAGLKVATL